LTAQICKSFILRLSHFKGDIYLSLKRYDESFACFTKAREIRVQKRPVVAFFRAISIALGIFSMHRKKYRSASFYYQSAVQEVSLFLKDEFLRFVYHQLYLDNTGMCYSKLFMWDSAMYFYSSALTYIKNEPGFL
jgi:tetratricopeptide (TPR) repeat protein